MTFPKLHPVLQLRLRESACARLEGLRPCGVIAGDGGFYGPVAE